MSDTFKAMAICDDSWYVLLNHLRHIFGIFLQPCKNPCFFCKKKQVDFLNGNGDSHSKDDRMASSMPW